ncbi:hypothetical protein B0H17DRAFT_1211201 [Mycena rosella]|uniref:NB-ARC domain-containing protein n=1 Tax=Mycena rosella TaxID=1033263 RepID=A0AAD7CUT5_MYCRO|nr:hypothetical protein B0H17DRAFT_1211201 [Mycena rosella]
MSPHVLDGIGRLAQILHKFYACLRSQQELGTIRRFFKQSEITAQLEACETELQSLLESFKVHCLSIPTKTIAGLSAGMEQRHEEILELLAAQSDSQSSDTMSLAQNSEMSRSSGALSIVPASPQIFHGRESELEEVVSALMHQQPARISVLGTGGIGKTALALAILHDLRVEQKYCHRYFVSCESANSDVQIISAVGVHLGLEPSRQLSKAIVQYFCDCGPALLVLDNMETPWEPVSTRAKVEDFLSLLTDVPHLALLITMRGAERPGKVKWTRPFLPPLEPISACATRQTFVDIAQEPTAAEEPALTELIELTGNLPIAVGLMANVASFEGYIGALSRWQAENTALLSEGYDKRSNLEKSVIMSLTSPRIKSNPNALDLLSLLSLLPDGISEAELLSTHVPLPAIPKCRSTLLQTSLAFLVDSRLKVVSPIRDYMRTAHPPSLSLTRPLRNHFQELLKVWELYYGLSPRDLVPQLTSNLGNIQSLLLNSLMTEGSAQFDVGVGILTLNRLSEIMLKGWSPLMQYLPGIIESSHDHHLKWRYLCACVDRVDAGNISEADVDALANEGVQYFIQARDPEGQAGAYLTLSSYYDRVGDTPKCLEFNQLGMELAKKIDHPRYQLRALLKRALIESAFGKYHDSIRHLREVQKLARVTGRVNEECSSVADEAIPLCRLGKFTEALECASQGHELLVKNGLQGSDIELGFLDRKAEIHFQKSEYAEARQLTELVVRMTARHRSPYFHANAVRTLAQIDAITGMDDSVILPKLITARQLAAELRWPHALVMCDILQCELDIRAGDVSKAYSALKSFVAEAELDAEIMYLSLESLGELSNGMCDVGDTFHWAAAYFAFAKKTQDLGHTYEALRFFGDIFLAQGDEQTALDVFQAVLDGSTEMDVHRRRADCMSRMGDIFMRRGELDRAKEMWESARPLFVRSSLAKDVSSIDSKLTQLALSIRADHEGFARLLSKLMAPTGQPAAESQDAEAEGSSSLKKAEGAAAH